MSRCYPGGQFGLLVLVPGAEPGGVGVEGHAASHDFHAHIRVARGGDLDGQSETVQELRTQFSFLRVHGADQHQTSSVCNGHPVAFHRVASHGRGVEENIHQVVVEQVDLVDVEDSPVRRGQQAGFEGGLSLAESRLQVQRSRDTILGGTYR